MWFDGKEESTLWKLRCQLFERIAISEPQNPKLRSQQNGKSKCLYGISNACMPEESGKWTTHCVEHMRLPWTLSHAHSCNHSYYQKWVMAFANIQEWWPQPDPYAPYDLWAAKISDAQTCRLAVGQYSHWGQLMSNAGEPKGLRMERLSQTCDANTTLETQLFRCFLPMIIM